MEERRKMTPLELSEAEGKMYDVIAVALGDDRDNGRIFATDVAKRVIRAAKAAAEVRRELVQHCNAQNVSSHHIASVEDVIATAFCYWGDPRGMYWGPTQRGATMGGEALKGFALGLKVISNISDTTHDLRDADYAFLIYDAALDLISDEMLTEDECPDEDEAKS